MKNKNNKKMKMMMMMMMRGDVVDTSLSITACHSSSLISTMSVLLFQPTDELSPRATSDKRLPTSLDDEDDLETQRNGFQEESIAQYHFPSTPDINRRFSKFSLCQ